jgi:hypothetical protein
MTTSRCRSVVSFVAALMITLGVSACAPRQSSLNRVEPSGVIRFDNRAQEYVHVYLVTEQRQWLLGRVDPGAQTTLRIPDAAVATNQGFARLAVVAGQNVTLQVARDPRATFTFAQPASAIIAQRWSFAQGQLTSPGLAGSRLPR